MALQALLNSLPLKGRERLTRLFLKRAGEVNAISHGLKVKLDLHDYIQRCVFLNCFERDDQDACAKLLNGGDAVLDIGANCGGYLTLFARCVGAQGQVVAFEPNPNLKIKLQFLQSKNNIPFVDIRYIALGAASGEVTLFVPPTGNENEDATVCKMKGWTPVTVPLSTIDEEFKDDSTTTFKLLKIDVEGMEQKIFEGGREMLGSGRIENLLVEFNPCCLGQQGSSCDRLFEYICSLGFRCTIEKPRFDANELLNFWFFTGTPLISRSNFQSFDLFNMIVGSQAFLNSVCACN